jgi:hypothetical protein
MVVGGAVTVSNDGGTVAGAGDDSCGGEVVDDELMKRE